MKSFKHIRTKIVKYFVRLRLQPIRVFVFHQVSAVFEPSTMWGCDWTEIKQFQNNVLKLKEKYRFITLEDAYNHLRKDKVRLKDYAVLTSDDGWASVLNIIPWLASQKIHLTLFLNPEYLDGKHYQERKTEKLLTKVNVEYLVNKYPDYVSVGSHGWAHFDVTKFDYDTFNESVEKSERILADFRGKIPFYAFTYGRYSTNNLKYLNQKGLIPVFVDGIDNISYRTGIHRECIDGLLLEK